MSFKKLALPLLCCAVLYSPGALAQTSGRIFGWTSLYTLMCLAPAGTPPVGAFVANACPSNGNWEVILLDIGGTYAIRHSPSLLYVTTTTDSSVSLLPWDSGNSGQKFKKEEVVNLGGNTWVRLTKFGSDQRCLTINPNGTPMRLTFEACPANKAATPVGQWFFGQTPNGVPLF